MKMKKRYFFQPYEVGILVVLADEGEKEKWADFDGGILSVVYLIPPSPKPLFS